MDFLVCSGTLGLSICHVFNEENEAFSFLCVNQLCCGLLDLEDGIIPKMVHCVSTLRTLIE